MNDPVFPADDKVTQAMLLADEYAECAEMSGKTGGCRDAVQIAREALRAHLAEHPAGVPAGWKLAPLEPTTDMVHAADKAEMRHVIEDRRRGGNDPLLGWVAAYKAMLAASPAPEGAEAKGAPLFGFDRSDLADIADALETGYEKSVNVGQAIEPGFDVHVESTTAAAARFIRAAMAKEQG